MWEIEGISYMKAETRDLEDLSPTEKSLLLPQQTYCSRLSQEFRGLLQAPRELWMSYLCAFLLAFALNCTGLVLLLYAPERFGVGDWAVSLFVGLIGPLYGAFALVEGAVADTMGIRFALVSAGLVLGASRVIAGTTGHFWVLCVAVLVLMPIGGGLGIPIAKYCIQRYTVTAQRVSAYTLLFIVLEVGSAVSAVFIDVQLSLSVSFLGCSAYQLLLWQAALASFMVAAVGLVVRNIEYDERGVVEGRRYLADIGYWEALRIAISRPQFRLLAFSMLILVPIKVGYSQLIFSLPKYMLREIGPNAHFGLILAIHPVVLILSAAIATPLTRSFSNYSLIILGSSISTLSGLILLAGASYWTCGLFVAVLSVGEGVWNPRLFAYVMALAPKGLEGPFAALMAIPGFLAFGIAGILSGVLLEQFCSQSGERSCYWVWVVTAGLCALSPALLLLCRRSLDLNPKLLDMPSK